MLVLAIDGETSIVWDKDRGRLRIGPHAVSATLARLEPPFDLPLDAGDSELMKQIVRLPFDEIEAAGYGADGTRLRTRWNESIEEAAAALSWTGISESTLQAVVGQVLGG